MSIDMFELKVYAILPALMLVAGALCLLLINVFSSVFSRILNVALSALFLGVSSIFSLNLKVGESFFGLINISGISILGQFSMELCGLIFIVLFGANKHLSTKLDTIDKSMFIKEFYPLFLLMIAGFDIMISSSHLVVMLLGLEIGSLSLCVLIALNGRGKGIEAGIKYFVMGVLASVFFIFGSACLYFACGSLDIAHIHNALIDEKYTSPFAVFVGIVFMLGAIGFKASAVPFHSWMPDIYEGANSIMAGVVSIIPKIAAFSIAIIIFGSLLKVGIIWLEYALYAIVIVSITLPNIAALMQQDVKRMLAYSSISHSGFVLACVMIGTQVSISALYLYWFMFLITNIGAFGLLWSSEGISSANTNEKDSNLDASNKVDSSLNLSLGDMPFSKFNGLIYLSPASAFLGAIFMFSLAGIPPFGVFWGKIWAILSAYSAGFVLLAVVMMINSAIAGFYYLRLVVAMFLRLPNADFVATLDGDNNTKLNNQSKLLQNRFCQNGFSWFNKIIVACMGILCCGSVFMAQFLLDFVGKYIIGAY